MKNSVRYLSIQNILLAGLFIVSYQSNSNGQSVTKSGQDANGYSHTYVTNDPTNTRIYTLKNGLKVYLSRNEIDPRIQTMVVFKVGSADDPETNTGLSHYLEHLLFKGTSQIGTQNWEMEKPLLDIITNLFDKYRSLTNEKERKSLYAIIDSVSQEASKYGIAEEVRRMLLSLGATYVNAATFKDHTVYFNPIPKNELERWAMISGSRFREFVPRYFHTELETVYEEFNSYENNDYYLTDTELEGLLFSDHPYGQKTNLGKPEHIKKTSITDIYSFFETYYRPDNAALCLSSDLEFEDAIQLIDRYFGDWKTPVLPLQKEMHPSKRLNKPGKAELVAPGIGYIKMGYKMSDASDIRGILQARLISTMLYSDDSKSGLLYYNMINQNLVHQIGVGLQPRNEGSILQITAYTIEGQNFTDLEALVLDQISKLTDGEFEEWLMQASANILENEHLANIEQNFGRSWVLANAYSVDINWGDQVTFYEKIKLITKDDIIAFAKEWLKPDAYAVVYKKSGQRSNTRMINKPEISAVSLNTDKISTFCKALQSKEPENQIAPKFYHFSTDISKGQIGNSIPLYHNKNLLDDRFWLIFSFDVDTRSEPRMELALEYINQLGTAKWSTDRFRQELLRIGCNITVTEFNGTIRYLLQGRESNFNQALVLFSDFIENMQPDQSLLDRSAQKIIEDRALQRKNRFVIQSALKEFLKYGENSKFLKWQSEEQLRSISAIQFTNWIKSWFQYEYEVYYAGIRSLNDLTDQLEKIFTHERPLIQWPNHRNGHKKIDQNYDYIINYDVAQCELFIIIDGPEYDPLAHAYFNLYRRYFGNNILFNEVRESRALAYNVYLNINLPDNSEQKIFLDLYLQTQMDKLPEALEVTKNLIPKMPKLNNEFNNALTAYIQVMNVARFYNLNLLNDFITQRKKGQESNLYDIIYERMNSIDLNELAEFHSKTIKNKPIKVGIIMPKDKMDLSALSKFGAFKELTIKDIFRE